MKKRIHKFLNYFLPLFICSFIQFYWSMPSLIDRMSSACMTCSFFEDTLLMSLVISLFCTVLFLLIFKLNNIYLKNCIAGLFLMALWYYFDYTMFVERESSWSTYLFLEEINITTSLAFVPIVIMTFVCLLSIHFRNKKSIKKVE
ncbi:hypothetical protein SAMN05660477_02382 [Soonwooa buanensis]|uniref:Uncharacterized protein n=1 Tax=Soonwooa buanensis TaxID=619805 RepID=A0A1T5FWZ0_9FLAO|nr:hypothetical protein [Soonwooa buanensis]SKC00607.1 hypothetical protein SAMN05660477_02382 [Soonwooa buanensis]